MSSGYEKGHGSGRHVRKVGYRMPGDPMPEVEPEVERPAPRLP